MTAGSPRVLVAVDGSDFSLRAAKRALELLAPSAAPTVLRVVRPAVIVPAAEGAPVAAVATEDVAEEDLERARTEVAGAVRNLGVEADARVEWGEPGSTICDIAAAEGFDVIVLGSHGAGWMKRLLVGSVSHHVVHHATCPVLVVREPDTRAVL